MDLKFIDYIWYEIINFIGIIKLSGIKVEKVNGLIKKIRCIFLMNSGLYGSAVWSCRESNPGPVKKPKWFLHA